MSNYNTPDTAVKDRQLTKVGCEINWSRVVVLKTYHFHSLFLWIC